MTRLMRPKALSLALVGGLCALAFTACSASDTDGSSAEAANFDRKACAAEAQGLADEVKAEAAVKLPEESLDLAELKGKTIWVINAVNTPLLLDIVEGIRAAAEVLEMNVKVVNAQGAATTMSQGVSSAVAQNAAGIILEAVDPDLLAGPLKKAYSKGIPVVDQFNGTPEDPLNGLFAHVEAPMKSDGARVADWMLADSGCDPDVHFAQFGSTVLSVHSALMDGADEEVKRLCPSCTIISQDFDSTKMATDLRSQAAAVLRRDPKVKYLFPVLDAGVADVLPAVRESDRAGQVNVVSHDGVAANLDNLRKNDGKPGGQVLDVAFPPSQWMGWALVDQVSRGILGLDAAEWTVPTRLIDASNIGASNDELFAGYEDFQKKFTQKWTGND